MLSELLGVYGALPFREAPEGAAASQYQQYYANRWTNLAQGCLP